MKPWHLIFLLALLVAPAARADYILGFDAERKLLAVGLGDLDGPQKPNPYVVDDSVCISMDDIKVACGDVFKVRQKGLIVYVMQGTAGIPKGTRVEVSRQVAIPRSRDITFGMNFLFPHVHVQQIFTEKLAYGLLTEAILLKRGVSTLKGIAALATVSYYGNGVYRGPWLMAGLGVQMVNKQPTPSEASRDGITSLVAQLNFGWRFRFSGDFNFGLAIGGQYFMDPNVREFTSFKGISPSAILDVGFAF